MLYEYSKDKYLGHLKNLKKEFFALMEENPSEEKIHNYLISNPLLFESYKTVQSSNAYLDLKQLVSLDCSNTIRLICSHFF